MGINLKAKTIRDMFASKPDADVPAQVSFTGFYHGAHQDHPAAARLTCVLTADVDGVTVSSQPTKKHPAELLAIAPWAEIRDVEVDGNSTTTQSGPSTAKVMAFGIYGMGGSRKTTTVRNAAIVMRTTRGNIVFQTIGANPVTVRSGLRSMRPPPSPPRHRHLPGMPPRR